MERRIGDLVVAGSTANTSTLYRRYVRGPNVTSQIIADGANLEIATSDDPTCRSKVR